MSRTSLGPPHLSTLILLSAVSVLSLNLFLPSLNNMALDFAVDYSVISMAVAGYLAITTVLQILIGPLSDRYGRRPVMLASVGIFTVGSLGCLLAESVTWFLAFRMLQGAIVAGGMLSMAVVRDIHPQREAASRIGYLSMAMGIGPMIGPIIGGGLDIWLGWRSTFGLFLLLGILLMLVCWIDLGETNRNRQAGFAAQFRQYPDLAKSRCFWGYALCIAFSNAAFFAFLAGAPLVATTILGLSAGELGFGIGSISSGFILGSYLSGRLASDYRLSTMMIVGRLISVFGLIAGLLLTWSGAVNPYVFFGSTLFVGIGNGVTKPSAHAGVVSVRPGLAGSASGFNGALTVGFGAIFTFLCGMLVSGESAMVMLLGLMLLCSMLALAAAWDVRDRE